MDLRQIARAVAAHKLVATLGVIAAIGFAFLAHVRVDPFGSPALAYRKPNLWGSTVTLQLTQQGFPKVECWRRTTAAKPSSSWLPCTRGSRTPIRSRRECGRTGPSPARSSSSRWWTRTAPPSRSSRSPRFAYTASSARERAKRQADAFRAYIAQQQELNHVRPTNRVILKVVSGPTAPAVVVPRKITLPVIVFLSMLIVTGGLILTLENLGTGAGARKPKSEEPGSETRAPPGGAQEPARRGGPTAALRPARARRGEPGRWKHSRASRPMRTLRSDGGPENGKSRRTEESGSPDVQQSRAADVQDVASQAPLGSALSARLSLRDARPRESPQSRRRRDHGRDRADRRVRRHGPEPGSGGARRCAGRPALDHEAGRHRVADDDPPAPGHHPLHPDPPVLTRRQPPLPAGALPGVRDDPRHRLGRLSPPRPAAAGACHRPRGPARAPRRRGAGVDRHESQLDHERGSLGRGRQEADVLGRVHDRALHGRKPLEQGRCRPLPSVRRARHGGSGRARRCRVEDRNECLRPPREVRAVPRPGRRPARHVPGGVEPSVRVRAAPDRLRSGSRAHVPHRSGVCLSAPYGALVRVRRPDRHGHARVGLANESRRCWRSPRRSWRS